jgi:hypothetical protein
MGINDLQWPSFKQFKREELIEIIKRLACRVGIFDPVALVSCAMGEVGRTRVQKLIDQAEKYSYAAHDARMRAIEMMNPYQGRKLGDIPDNVLVQINQYFEEAEKADALYEKCMKEAERLE